MSYVAKLIKQRVDTETFLDNLHPEDIYSEDSFNAFKYSAFYFIENLDEDGALVFSQKLEKILSLLTPKDANEQSIVKILNYWLLRLKIFCFRVLSDQDKNELFKKYIVNIFKNEIDFRAAVYKYIDIFSSGDFIEDITKGFVSAVTGSQVILGRADGNFKPTVANWIKEYQTILRSFGNNIKLQPGAFHIVKFLDTNQYAKMLKPTEQDVFRDFLDFYNWLLMPVVYDDKKPPSSYMTQEKSILPSEIKAKQVKPDPQVVKSEFLTGNVSNSGLDGAGLRLGNMGIKPLPPKISFSPLVKKPQVDIDRKLEDLKKKVL